MIWPNYEELRKIHPKKPSIILTDLDGTMIGQGLEFEQSTLAAYKKALKYGFRVILATGRALTEVYEILDLIGLRDVIACTPGIYLNGAATYGNSTNASMLSEHYLQFSIVYTIIHLYQSHSLQTVKPGTKHESDCFDLEQPGLSLLSVDTQSEKDEFEIALYSHDQCAISEWSFKNKLLFGDLSSFVKKYESLIEFAQLNKVVKILMLFTDVESCQRWKEKLLQNSQEFFDVTSSLPTVLEIIPKGVSKALGIQKIMSHIDCKIEDVVVIGDGENDIEMFKKSPLSFCMGNATPYVQSFATYVTRKRKNQGWSDVIELLIRAYC